MDAVEEVKARLNIEDVIGEYVGLKRSGRNWKGLSPFTSEKTPSFTVSPDKQIWHDFSSNKGGDVFSFVMEVEGLDFKATLELLARKAGIDLEQYKIAGQRGGPNKERLYDVLELAAKFYQVQFSKSKRALEYVFKTRQFSKETALLWRLGYAPNNGSALLDFAKSKGFSEQEIKQAGLSAQRYRGAGDMFRGRLMIPLHDGQGRVIGFTARLLEDQPGAPKYINTPQTVLYDKSRHIYGLHLSKEAIRKSGFAVLVEGNLDVIASHQVAVNQVVATAGTALTEPHLKALGRLSNDIRLSFDADKAGIAATERAIPIASRVGVSLSIIDIPTGKDPDELIKQDPALWQQAISKHQYALDWLMQRYRGLLDISSAQGKRQYSDVLLPIVKGLSDDVERDHYLSAIAQAIDVSREALTAKLSKTSSDGTTARRKSVKQPTQQPDLLAVEHQKLQDHFLSLLVMRPTLREMADLITPDMLYTDQARQVLTFLKTHPDMHESLEQAPELQSLADYVKIEAVLYEELYHGLELNELHYEAARLQTRLVETYVKTQKAHLAQKLTAADDAVTHQLLQQAKLYDQLLNQVTGSIAHAESKASSG
jgi:DNA primase